MSRLSNAIHQIETARRFTLEWLAKVDQADWFRMPSEGGSHIGWQVGHLAMADYMLLLRRIRGKRPEDAELIAPEFLALVGRGSVAQPDASLYPTPDEILAILHCVRVAAIDELNNLADEELDNPPGPPPHRYARTKLGVIQWCALHEMHHNGQMALLRRLLGMPFQW